MFRSVKSSNDPVKELLTLQEAQLVIEAWRREYNEERTHSAIGDVTAMEFINHYHNQPQTAQESTSLAVV